MDTDYYNGDLTGYNLDTYFNKMKKLYGSPSF